MEMGAYCRHRSGVWFIRLLFLLTGCQAVESKQPAGIALSFDDRFIHEWYQLRPIFKKYDAHVTFYITQFDSLTPVEIAQLKTLQQDGHEIGCHGAIHTNAVQYVRDHSVADYINAEVYPALRSMQSKGFRPTSFAFPGGAHTRETDQELLKHFVMLRDVAQIERTVWGIRLHGNVRLMPWIFYHFNGDCITDALLFDEGAGLAPDDLRTALHKAKDDQSVLLLFGHKPYAHRVEKGGYGFLAKRLELILLASNRLNLKTYTMSELVRLSKP